MNDQQRYWLVVASKDHVERGVAGGFMQANHGKQAPLKRTKPGDWVIFYSPRQSFAEVEPCQAFTAIGQVRDEPIYQVTLPDDFAPYRRNVTFYPSAELPIRPLIDELDFIQNKKAWGYTFRFGFLEISQEDAERIRRGMLDQ